MKKYLIAVLTVMLLAATAPASAGPFADDMAKCLVRATTTADKSSLVQWMFATMSLHPDVKQFAAVKPEQRAALNKRFGDLIVSLLTERCVTESKTALKNEGMSVIESSFNLLGQVAAQELFSHADVASGLADFGKLVDAEKLKKLLDEAK